MSAFITGDCRREPEHMTPEYLSFERESATIRLVNVDIFGNRTPIWWNHDVYYEVYKKDPKIDNIPKNEHRHFYHKNHKPVRRSLMSRMSEIGKYRCDYAYLEKGSYSSFAIAENATYIDTD